jgi:hypothetical protein
VSDKSGRVTASNQHPPFRGGPARSSADYMTEEGAHRLATMIEAAWAKCGHDVIAVVQNVSNERHNCFTVRMPGLVNGLPKR